MNTEQKSNIQMTLLLNVMIETVCVFFQKIIACLGKDQSVARTVTALAEDAAERAFQSGGMSIDWAHCRVL